MAKIPNFSKTQLRYGAHFSIMTSFDERVAPLAESESMLTKAYGEFKTALGYEDSAIKIARASEYSNQILTEDNKRDRLYNNGKATAEMWRDTGIEPYAAAAAAVLREYDTYKVDTKAQYDQQTGLMLNFLQSFESGAMKEKLQTLGLTAVFEQMKIANEAVRSLLSQRGDERAANAAYDIKKARTATDAAYDKLVDRINALQTLDETGKYDAFVAWWSQEIARIKQQILNQKGGTTSGGSSSGTGGGTTGGGTTDPGTTTDPETPGTGGGGSTDSDPENPGTGGGTTPDPSQGGGSTDPQPDPDGGSNSDE